MKTVQAIGTTLLPEYSNAINGVDANTGIILDGADEDGHGPKLDLADHVQNVLLKKNFSYFESNFALQASVDGGSTYTVNFNVDIMRVAQIVTIRFLANTVFIMGVSGQPIMIRPNGGGNWDANLFGLQDSFSQVFPLSTLSTIKSLTAYYTGVLNDIQIFESNIANFALNDDITLAKGTTIMTTLNISES